MLTIEPGIFFGHAAVRCMRVAGVTDDDVAADIAALESGETTPAEIIARDDSNWSRLYVAGLCRCVGIDVRGVFA